MPKNKYEKLSIIKYKELGGLKRTLYGMITGKLNDNCWEIMEGFYPFKINDRFLDPKTDTDSIKIIQKFESIDGILDSERSGLIEKDMFKKIVRLYRNSDEKDRETIRDLIFNCKIK